MSDHEIVHIFDSTGQVIGTMTRGEAEAANYVTPNVLVFIFDSQGRVWVQLRPQNKKHFPGLWDISACGGVLHDETPELAASREQFEEMGFSADLAFVETFMNAFPDGKGGTFVRHSHLFIGVSDEEPKTNDEVDEFRAFHHDDLRQHVSENPDHYTPSFLAELDKAILAYRNLVKL